MSKRHVARRLVGIVVAGLALTACGLRGGDGDELAAVDVPISCVGDPITVGDRSASLVGIGRSSTDLYRIENLILRSEDDEKIVIPIFEGARLPAGNGTVAWHDHLLTVTEQNVSTPKNKLAPCARIEVGPIPAGYVSPTDESIP